MVPDDVLRLLPDCGEPKLERAGSSCRASGCAASAQGGLGFCSVCERRYDAVTARRGRLIEALCTRLAALGDPLYAAFGTRPEDFGAHVLAHLEELEAIDLHVPAAAIEDFVAELDARRRR